MELPYILTKPPNHSAYYQMGRNYILGDRGVFTFGSNTAGRHGKGAALEALRYGAVYGQGVGMKGRTYAIPTKDAHLRVLSLEEIYKHVQAFRWVCEVSDWEDQNTWYYVTPIGTGLAGYKHQQIAPMFIGTPNCWFPDIWKPWLGQYPGIYPHRQQEYHHAS